MTHRFFHDVTIRLGADDQNSPCLRRIRLPPSASGSTIETGGFRRTKVSGQPLFPSSWGGSSD
jgi:hypothetical protein